MNNIIGQAISGSCLHTRSVVSFRNRMDRLVVQHVLKGKSVTGLLSMATATATFRCCCMSSAWCWLLDVVHYTEPSLQITDIWLYKCILRNRMHRVWTEWLWLLDIETVSFKNLPVKKLGNSMLFACAFHVPCDTEQCCMHWWCM